MSPSTASLQLDEAIQHASEKGLGDSVCAAEHRQLAGWLIELKNQRESEDSLRKALDAGPAELVLSAATRIVEELQSWRSGYAGAFRGYTATPHESLVRWAEEQNKIKMQSLAALRRKVGSARSLAENSSELHMFCAWSQVQSLSKVLAEIEAILGPCDHCGGDARIRCGDLECVECAGDRYCEQSMPCPSGCKGL